MTEDSRGTGHTIALELARHGCQVAVMYTSSSAAAEETCAEIHKMSTRTEAYRCDVSDPAQHRIVVRRIMDGLGRVDVLVNNAGIVRDAVAVSVKDKDLATMPDTNLKGTVYMIREYHFGFIRQRSGSVISVSSVVALLGRTGQATYAAAKAGLIGLTKSVAREVAARGIRCSTIAPGIIETEMTEFMQGDESRLALVPMCRFEKPTEVTNLVVFLAGDTSPHITGEVVRVDEGLATWPSSLPVGTAAPCQARVRPAN